MHTAACNMVGGPLDDSVDRTRCIAVFRLVFWSADRPKQLWIEDEAIEFESWGKRCHNILPDVQDLSTVGSCMGFIRVILCVA